MKDESVFTSRFIEICYCEDENNEIAPLVKRPTKLNNIIVKNWNSNANYTFNAINNKNQHRFNATCVGEALTTMIRQFNYINELTINLINCRYCFQDKV